MNTTIIWLLLSLGAAGAPQRIMSIEKFTSEKACDEAKVAMEKIIKRDTGSLTGIQLSCMPIKGVAK